MSLSYIDDCHFWSLCVFSTVEPSVIFFFGPVCLKTLPLPKSLACFFSSFLPFLILETLWSGVARCREWCSAEMEASCCQIMKNLLYVTINQGDQLSQKSPVHISLVLRWQLLDKHSIWNHPSNKLAIEVHSVARHKGTHSVHMVKFQEWQPQLNVGVSPLNYNSVCTEHKSLPKQQLLTPWKPYQRSGVSFVWCPLFWLK